MFPRAGVEAMTADAMTEKQCRGQGLVGFEQRDRHASSLRVVRGVLPQHGLSIRRPA